MATAKARKHSELNEPSGDETGGYVHKYGKRMGEGDWAQLVALVLHGHSLSAIARMTGHHPRILRRYMKDGLPKKPWGTPIRHIVEQEQAKARALREEATARFGTPVTPVEIPVVLSAEEQARIEGLNSGATLGERSAMRQDALDARTAEAILVKLSRGNVQQLAGASVALLAPAKLLAAAIGAAMVRASEQNAKGFDSDAALHTLREVARYVKDVVDAGHKAMEMERLLLGDPSAAGRTAQEASTMTQAEAMAHLGNAAKLHAAMQAKGLRIVNGGKSSATTAPQSAEDEPSATIDGGGVTFDASTSKTVDATPTATQETQAAGAAEEETEDDEVE